MNRSLLSVGVALLVVFAATAWKAHAADLPVLMAGTATVPAAGRHEALLPVSQWGRYSLRSSGDVPVAISVANRRSGILQRDGEPGRRHGRIDLFLDIGEVKLAAQGPKKTSGQAILTATPFAYPPGFKPGWLIPLRENRFSLDDLQQAAFWFEARTDTVVYIEAAGRNLAEVVLWRDGEWLMPITTKGFVSKPKPETPLTGFSFAAHLSPGTYMLGLYGGKGRPWALASQEHPCYVRAGIEPIAANLRSARTVPPEGYAQFLLAPEVASVIVETPNKNQRLMVEVHRHATDFSSASWMAGDSIHGKSSSPRVIFHTSELPADQGWRTVRLSGVPGKPYSLQTFGAGAWSISGNVSQSWRISSVHSGNAADQLGASAVIVGPKGEIKALQADTVGPKELARKFNSLDPMTAFIYVAENGKYVFRPGGSKYRWSLGRFYTNPPPNYKAPELSADGKVLELTAGLHRLILEPESKGIATFVLAKAGLLGGMFSSGKSDWGKITEHAWNAPASSILFPEIVVPGDQTFALYLNSQSPELGALIAQKLPLPSVPKPMAPPTGPAPEFPDAKRAAIAKYTAIETGKVHYFDLDRNAYRPFALRVKEPGLYRVETTGRLQTTLGFADRFQQFTREASSNGVGRNAQLIEYLVPGEYMVNVMATGGTGGRLGVTAYRNAVIEGGVLEVGIDNRKFVEAFSGAAYDVCIPATGKYKLESQGQNGGQALRLEDKGGWPVEPALGGDSRMEMLAKGEYRLYSQPQPQEGRRVARLTAIAEKRTLKGKGPHALALNTTLASTWLDNDKDGGKGDSLGAPAVFVFSLPAPITAKLNVSNGFQATLTRNGQDTAVLRWSGSRKQKLPMGDYRLLVLPEKKRNLAPYQVSVASREMIPGSSFDLSRKETFAVSLGAPSIVEFASQGMLDMTATLLAEDGKTVIALNDDGFLDWNFSLSLALKAGRYFLRAEAVEPGFTQTTVFMRALSDTLLDTLASSSGKAVARTLRLNRRLGVFPLSDSPGDVIACGAVGKTRLGLALEKAEGSAWVPVAQSGGLKPALAVPRAAGARYRLKAWSETNADDPVTVAYLAAQAATATAQAAASGLAAQPELVGEEYRTWFKVDLGNRAPGQFRVVSEGNPLSSVAVATQVDSAFDGEDGLSFGTLAQYAWVEMRSEQAGRITAKLEPWVLESGKSATQDLRASRVSVFETQQGNQSLGLAMVDADGAYPVAGILKNISDKGSHFEMRGLKVSQAVWMGSGRAAAVALPGDIRRVALWNALAPLDGTRPSARIAWTELPLEQGEPLTPGVTAWNPGKKAARRFSLPTHGAGARVRVILPPASAAYLVRPDGSAELECDFGDEPIAREFKSQGGDLYLLALDGPSRFDVALYSASENPVETPFHAGAGRALPFSREGVTLLPVAAEKSLGLYFRGAVKSVDWVGRDGRLRPDLHGGSPVGPGGFLVLRHEAGFAQLNLCEAKTGPEVMACKWEAPLAPKNPAEILQSSLVTLHERVNWFTFTLQDTQHVNFSAPNPLAAVVVKDGAAIRYQEAWERFNWDLPLPPGKYALGIRPFAGASLEGVALASLFRPIAPLSEKKPFTAYLGSGESRLLRFDVTRGAEFGLGLRLSKETVESRLYDSQGQVVAQGKQQFVRLQPGTYHLWLRVPEGAEGTEVTANVFGQDPPPNDPPEKLVKWIVTGAEGERPETTLEQAADPDEQRPAWERFIKRDEYGRTREEIEAAAQAEAEAQAAQEGGDGEYREGEEQQASETGEEGNGEGSGENGGEGEGE